MPNHVRTQARQAMAAACIGLQTTSTRVFQSSVYETQDADLPCLCIYATGDEVVDESIGNLIGRQTQFVVEGKAKAVADLDDKLDEIAKEVETVLSVPITVANQPTLFQYEGAEIEMIGGERPTGMITLRYSALLYTQRSTPDVIG